MFDRTKKGLKPCTITIFVIMKGAATCTMKAETVYTSDNCKSERSRNGSGTHTSMDSITASTLHVHVHCHT